MTLLSEEMREYAALARDNDPKLICSVIAGWVLDVVALETSLRECSRLAGADLSDGFPSWPALSDFAVSEVRQLREDYDAG